MLFMLAVGNNGSMLCGVHLSEHSRRIAEKVGG